MTMQRTRRLRRFRGHDAVVAIEPLESRALLSSVSTFLKFAGTAPVVSGSSTGVPSLQNGSVSLGTIDVTSKTRAISVVPSTGDLSTYRYVWQVTNAPEGGSVSFSRNSSNAAKQTSLTFTKAGTFDIRVSVETLGVPFASATMTFNVIPTSSSISVRTSGGQTISSTTGLSTSDTRVQLNPTTLDQFGNPLETQPGVVWQLAKPPAGTTPALTTESNAASVTVNRAGKYGLTASVGSIKTTIPLTVTQSLTSYALSRLDKTPLDSGAALNVTSTSLQLNFSAFDQFAQPMSTLPSITWTTLAPSGQKATASLGKGVLTVTYSGSGTYSTETTIAGQTFRFTADVIPTLSTIRVQNSAGASVSAKAPATIAGKELILNATALDQFGIALAEQPGITWQTTSAVTGSTSKLTTQSSQVLFEPDTAGKYTLRAQSGVVSTDVAVTVSQTLTSMALVKQDGSSLAPDESLVVDKTSSKLKLNALDQFGKAMISLPKIVWTTPVVPTGGAATVKLSGTNTDVSFIRIGNYTIGASFGTVSTSASFSVTPTLTSFAIARDGVVIAKPSTPTTISGTSLSLNAIGRDQFGIALTEQPLSTWQITAAPVGSAAKLTTNSGQVLFEPDTAGKYTLRVFNGSILTDAAVTVAQTLTSMELVRQDGSPSTSDQPLPVDKVVGTLTLNAVDQFGKAMVTLPKLSWTTTVAPVSGTATVKLTGTKADVTFNRIGSYSVRTSFGSVSASASFSVTPTLTSFAVFSDGKTISGSTTPTAVSEKSISLTAVARDQFGQTLESQPTQNWAVTAFPADASPTVQSTDSATTITFTKSGPYTATVSAGSVTTAVRFSVAQTATSIELTPSTFSLLPAASQQMSARVIDQFGQPLTKQPTLKWSATGGTISSRGLYVAGGQTGQFTITATAGTISATATPQITPPVAPTGLVDPNLNSLVNTFYADQSLDRSEMIQVLRSAGSDGTVSSLELADLQFLVSATTPFSMPSFVRSLASDVVGTNPANLKYQGQTLGNLAAGSVTNHLNKLVDKWFLGSDEPQITGSGLTYQTTTGNLFNGTPSRSDTRQGALGDCYFIAAVAAIADRNPDAVRNMFIDNGDGTYTVRFFHSGSSGMTADYVTVNRRLPAYSNGALGYSGYGLRVNQSTTTLWIALAEKAYAQWNETGLSGRDGTNRYAAIEGGWMWYVNQQVLGIQSAYTHLSSSTKNALVNALSSQQAVTIGTWSNASAGGLYGSHAYIVAGYNSSTDTFTLHNPWGVSHPTPLTWSQLQSSCSIFVTTGTSGLNSSASGTLKTTPPKMLVTPAQRLVSGTVTDSVPSVSFTSIEESRPLESANDKGIGTTSIAKKNSRRSDSLDSLVERSAFSTQAMKTELSSDLDLILLDLAFTEFDLQFS